MTATALSAFRGLSPAMAQPTTSPRSPAPLTATRPANPLAGKIRVPGDKSISHRALMLGALAIGRTEISGLLEGADALATAPALRPPPPTGPAPGPRRGELAGARAAAVA